MGSWAPQDDGEGEAERPLSQRGALTAPLSGEPKKDGPCGGDGGGFACAPIPQCAHWGLPPRGEARSAGAAREGRGNDRGEDTEKQ